MYTSPHCVGVEGVALCCCLNPMVPVLYFHNRENIGGREGGREGGGRKHGGQGKGGSQHYCHICDDIYDKFSNLLCFLGQMVSAHCK